MKKLKNIVNRIMTVSWVYHFDFYNKDIEFSIDLSEEDYKDYCRKMRRR